MLLLVVLSSAIVDVGAGNGAGSRHRHAHRLKSNPGSTHELDMRKVTTEVAGRNAAKADLA
jgi:hypothetical protein